MRALKIFVSHSFSNEHHQGGVTSFRQAIESAVYKAQGTFEENVKVETQFVLEKYDKALFEEVMANIRAADILIADLNGLRPNVLIEIGTRFGMTRAPIVIANKKICPHIVIPSELSHLIVGYYDSHDNLPSIITPSLKEQLQIALADIKRDSIKDVWFNTGVDRIEIICSPEPKSQRTAFANRKHENYLFIDNLEDRDALFDIAVLASRMYPKATISRHDSNQVAPDVLGQNLLVIGGPGFGEDDGNKIAEDIIANLDLNVGYKNEDEESVEFYGKLYKSDKSKSGVEIDYGYFAKVRNPNKSSSFVILMQGIFTAGTHGACVAFSDSADALKNHKWLQKNINNFTSESQFEVLLKIKVGFGGMVTPAMVKPIKVMTLPE